MPIIEPETRRDRLQRMLADAKAAGFKVRREWLGGETGGSCEINGVRWLFIDASLSIEEQIGQVRDALSGEVIPR